ncbi:MAG: glucose-1-phosphate cytidylyltransferase [bacterium]|nr:glucose-1-phosphate cytidylyltransferase [bacterium]
MKVVILAGGYGTRLSEETGIKPKTMVEIGGKPILWHIMKIYSYYGFNDFIVCLGYKGYQVKEYFHNYYLHLCDLTINLENNTAHYHRLETDPWNVTLIDTGLDTQTGGRIKRIQPYVNNETFMLTYGDGLSNINLNKLLQFHKEHGKYATLTSALKSERFGSLEVDEQNQVTVFKEKPDGHGTKINGGFFILEPQIFDYISNDESSWEKEPLENIAKDNQLMAYHHDDFWQPMDILHDKRKLESLWSSGKAPWKLW